MRLGGLNLAPQVDWIEVHHNLAGVYVIAGLDTQSRDTTGIGRASRVI